MTPTSFVLSGPAGTVVADGIATGYADAADLFAAPDIDAVIRTEPSVGAYDQII